MAKQLSLADALVHANLGRNAKLEAIDKLIVWSRLEPLVRRIRRGVVGRPPYEPLAMLKALYLQSLYDLSDPGLEEALLDRLSFRRFCGFALDGRTPDETTILRFREDAQRLGVLGDCFDAINTQLDERKLILKKGTLMDATLLQATLRPPSPEAGLGAGNPKEPEASWTKKNGKAHFGYKMHIGVDQGSGLIRRVILTPAHIYESLVADGLICGDERAVYGDKAYEKKTRRKRLREAGIKDRIMHRRHKHIAVLPPWQEKRNQLIARHRAPVEAPFSAFKRIYGFARTRCTNIMRNTADTILLACAYNLRRATRLPAA